MLIKDVTTIDPPRNPRQKDRSEIDSARKVARQMQYGKKSSRNPVIFESANQNRQGTHSIRLWLPDRVKHRSASVRTRTTAHGKPPITNTLPTKLESIRNDLANDKINAPRIPNRASNQCELLFAACAAVLVRRETGHSERAGAWKFGFLGVSVVSFVILLVGLED